MFYVYHHNHEIIIPIKSAVDYWIDTFIHLDENKKKLFSSPSYYVKNIITKMIDQKGFFDSLTAFEPKTWDFK